MLRRARGSWLTTFVGVGGCQGKHYVQRECNAGMGEDVLEMAKD